MDVSYDVFKICNEWGEKIAGAVKAIDVLQPEKECAFLRS